MKKHRLGSCPCCNGVHRVTADGRMYRHFQKGWTQPGPVNCLGSSRPAKEILEDEGVEATPGLSAGLWSMF